MRKQLLTKMLLIAASLFVGTSEWAGVLTLYQQNFNSETGIPTGWTQASGTLSLEVSGENKWLRETTSGSGSRTAWYTGSAIKDAIGSHTSYTLEFDCLIKEGHSQSFCQQASHSASAATQFTINRYYKFFVLVHSLVAFVLKYLICSLC